jgi:hypothetical protein
MSVHAPAGVPSSYVPTPFMRALVVRLLADSSRHADGPVEEPEQQAAPPPVPAEPVAAPARPSPASEPLSEFNLSEVQFNLSSELSNAGNATVVLATLPDGRVAVAKMSAVQRSVVGACTSEVRRVGRSACGRRLAPERCSPRA